MLPAISKVAAQASHHIRAEKIEGPDGRIETRFVTLASQEDRIDELSEMLGKLVDLEIFLAHSNRNIQSENTCA